MSDNGNADQQALFTAAQSREHQEGYSDRENREIADHGGIVRDETVSRALSVRSIHYDPTEAERPDKMPGESKDLTKHQKIRRVEGTKTFREAMENGDMTTIKHMVGDTSQRPDISGMQAIQKIDQIIESPAPVIVILGEMGTGKTDLACSIGDRATHLLNAQKAASNVPTLKECDKWTPDPELSVEDGQVVDQDGNPADGEIRDGFVPNFRALDDWVKQDGDPLENDQQQKIFIGDEFSSEGDGSGKSGFYMRKKMGPLVFKIRKYDGLLIYVAHDESSIHPLLWRLGVIIKKTSKKEAIVADKIKSGEVRDIRFRLTGIPQTDWRYNTDDPAVWSWTGAEDDETALDPDTAEAMDMLTVVRNRDCADPVAYRDLAEFTQWDASTCSRRYNSYCEDGKYVDMVQQAEELIA